MKYCPEDDGWPANLPEDIRKSIRRLEIYKRKGLLAFYAEAERLEALTKSAEIWGTISEKDLRKIFRKLGV